MAQALSAQPQAYEHPRLSPEGGRIATWITQGTDRNVWTYDIARDAFSKLTFDGSNSWPAWHPDGRTIFFASLRPGRDWDIFSKPSDGSGGEERVFAQSDQEVPRDVSPDGQWLAFDVTSTETAFDIWLLRLGEQRAPHPFANSRAAERLPAFSPDNRWIAYQSNESGRMEVYIRPADGRAGKMAESPGKERSLAGIQMAREIFYRDGTQMFAVAVSTGNTVTPGKPQLLFENASYRLTNIGTNYDVARDGQRLLMIKEERSDAPPSVLQVVTNFFAELTKASR